MGFMPQESQFISMLPTDLWGWAALLAIDIAGILAIVGFVDKTRQQRIEEARKLSDDLIEGLRNKIDSMDQKIDEQNKIIDDLRKESLRINTENATLKSILQGIDPDSVNYRKRSYASMQLGVDTNRIVKETHQKLLDLNTNIEKLYIVIEKHLQVIREQRI